ncbi:hypothetical protein [Zhihengliuella sp.]|uniref:hypothetical protein n=1 Tax=Zhihengliuella sp. TaxID=1954483 RepID=UPI002812298E|nr:hypothetical protein [Zhihengliuella sp.]
MRADENPGNQDPDGPNLDDVINSGADPVVTPTRRGHGKMPEDVSDEDYTAAEERERAAAGLEDFAPADVPPATDPAPPGTSDEAIRAERGIADDDGPDLESDQTASDQTSKQAEA